MRQRIETQGRRWSRPASPLLPGLVICLLLTVTGHVEAAQSTNIAPGAVAQHSNNTRKYYDLQQQLEKKPEESGSNVTNKTNAHAPTPKAPGPTFLLKKIETNSSAILTAAEINKIKKRYEGQQVGMADLQKIVASFNALYAAKGYVTARAVLPPQKVVGGVVRIQLVEGRVGKVTVEGNRHTDASYIEKRVPLPPGALVQVGDLEQQLVYFNRTNDIRLRATLEPGALFGTTDVKLRVTPTDNASTSIWYDNAGYDSIGSHRVGLTQEWKSLTGHRDRLAIGGYSASGTSAGYASYDYPVTVGGARLGASISYDKIKVRTGPLQPLAVRGDFYDFSLRWTQPLVATRRTLFEVSLAPHYQRSSLESSTVPVSNGRVRTLVVGGSLQSIDRRGVWIINNSLTFGSHNLAGSHYFSKDDLAITRWMPLGKGFVSVFRINGQARLSGMTPLPPSEQFRLGGLSTVRGYPEGALVGDSGYLVSAELDAPLLLFGSNGVNGAREDRLKLALFVDHGGVIGLSQKQYATGAGAGLILNFSHYLTGRLTAATPLRNRNGLDRWKFEFYLQSRF